jgi:SnoaL-like protein
MNLHERLAERMAKVLSDLDWDAFEAMLTEDYVEDYPQSGEVIRGSKNARAVRENYPGGLREDGLDPSTVRMMTSDRWVRTPAFTVARVEGAGSAGTASYRGTYPDGSVWWVVVLYELRGERIAKATMFFAPVFEAPEWRKPYVDSAKARA